jgi:hypothetical protein
MSKLLFTTTVIQSSLAFVAAQHGGMGGAGGAIHTMMQCQSMAASVTSACCTASNCQGVTVPSTCPSTACSDTYRPFYLTCGALLQVIESTVPDNAGFSALYQSCVHISHATNAATGAVVDNDVQASNLYNFAGPSPAPTSSFRVTLDNVMGGRSHGTFAASSSATCSGALLSGTVELQHGGFVNVRSQLAAGNPLQSADGIRVCSKSTVDYGVSDGVGDMYKVLLSDDSRNSWQADFHTTEAGSADANLNDGCDGAISTVPFSQFWPSHWGQITGAQGSINVANIDGIGFDISIQTQDGSNNPELDHDACAHPTAGTHCQNLNPFGLCIQWIQAYTNTAAVNGGEH